MIKNERALLFLLTTFIFIGFGCDDSGNTPEAVATMTVVPTTGIEDTAVPHPPSPTEPTILIEPETALADEPVTIQVQGLEPGQPVTLRASMRDGYSRKQKIIWKKQPSRWRESRGQSCSFRAKMTSFGNQPIWPTLP